MDKTAWILTEEYNEYNQYGGYFVTWWPEKPTEEQLAKWTDPLGRRDNEDTGFELNERHAGKR